MNSQQRSPFVNILAFVAFFAIGIFISQFLVLVTLYPILGDKVMSLANILQNINAYPDYKYIILYVQGFTSLFSMIIVSLIYLRVMYRDKINFFTHVPNEMFFLATAVLVIVSMPLNAWIADLNMSVKLPEFLSGFESWAAIKEEELKILTEYLTTFSDNIQFFVGLIVIALIPAVGEELIFRGIIQTNLKDLFKNSHLAIWISAILFSAIHLQFYGFFPRMFLGALFGYLFVWTGNILIPMMGHFVNNGFTLFLIHMKTQNKLKIDLESTKDLPVGIIIGSGILTILSLVLFKMLFDKKQATID